MNDIQNTEQFITDIQTIEKLKNIKNIIEIKSSNDHVVLNVELNDNSVDKIDICNKDLSIFMKNIFMGYLKKELHITEDLTPIHKHFDENASSTAFPINENRIDIVSKTQYGENRIKYLKSSKRLINYVNGKQVSTKQGKNDIDFVSNAIMKPAIDTINGYNITVNGDLFNIVNNNYYVDNTEGIRSDDQFIKDLTRSNSTITDQFKFCSSEHSNFNGVYLCGPNTGIWRKEHNATINKMLTYRLKEYVPMLTEKETKYIETQKNKTGLRMAFIEQIIDNDFEKKIDEVLDVFAMKNKVFDIRTKQIRKAIPYDFIFTNTGWEYDEKEAEKYLPDIEDFFQKLFPIKEEREVVVTYFASLLHGYRTDKYLLALTDKRNGNNGKTTLISLMRIFFGDYTKTNNSFFLKSHFGKDKDSHDGGTAPLKGKRLLISDELKKSQRLDEGTVKNITGGANQEIQGRKMGKEETFRFTVQCGVVLVFNEGDCPKFDATDGPFMERLIIVPMRSKFVVCEDEDHESFTYKKDPNIIEKFKLWRSALLNYFIRFTKKEGLTYTKIPKSMLEWKSEIVNDNNELKDWLFSVIQEDQNGFVSLSELRDKYKAAFPHDRSFKTKDIERMINSLFNSKGVYIKDVYSFYDENRKRCQKRNIYIGFKIM